MNRKTGTTTLRHLLDDPRVRRMRVEEQTLYSAVDLVAMLTDADDARVEWENLKHVEAPLRARCMLADLPGAEDSQDALNLTGVMHLVQAIDSPKADRLRAWLADVAAQHVAEEDDPVLAIQRLRQAYESKGRTRQWIDQRLRCIGTRNEIVGEWSRRGISESDDFSALTNQLTEAVFGMDVNAFRQAKGIQRDLRDHLSELELALLSLAETTAADLHRRRQSEGMEALERDVRDAGRIISDARWQIAQAGESAHHPVAA